MSNYDEIALKATNPSYRVSEGVEALLGLPVHHRRFCLAIS